MNFLSQHIFTGSRLSGNKDRGIGLGKHRHKIKDLLHLGTVTYDFCRTSL